MPFGRPRFKHLLEVTDDTLSLEVMRGVCLSGPGHYLGSGQTLQLMQTEYVYPRLGDRTSPKEWLEIGRPDLVENASKEKNRILGEHFPHHIDAATDAAVRADHSIHLPPGAVGL